MTGSISGSGSPIHGPQSNQGKEAIQQTARNLLKGSSEVREQRNKRMSVYYSLRSQREVRQEVTQSFRSTLTETAKEKLTLVLNPEKRIPGTNANTIIESLENIAYPRSPEEGEKAADKLRGTLSHLLGAMYDSAKKEGANFSEEEVQKLESEFKDLLAGIAIIQVEDDSSEASELIGSGISSEVSERSDVSESSGMSDTEITETGEYTRNLLSESDFSESDFSDVSNPFGSDLEKSTDSSLSEEEFAPKENKKVRFASVQTFAKNISNGYLSLKNGIIKN